MGSHALPRVGRGTLYRHFIGLGNVSVQAQTQSLIPSPGGIQVRWLLQLSELEAVTEVPPFTESGRHALSAAAVEFGEEDGAKVKEVERTTNHDVKAIEYVLKERFKDHPEVSKVRIPYPGLTIQVAILQQH